MTKVNPSSEKLDKLLPVIALGAFNARAVFKSLSTSTVRLVNGSSIRIYLTPDIKGTVATITVPAGFICILHISPTTAGPTTPI